MTKTAWKCSTSTSQSPPPTSVSHPHGRSTSALLPRCRTPRQRKCVSSSQRWKGGWARSTARAPSTDMHHSSAIHAPAPSSGRSGRASKSSTETRIHTRRCYGSSAACRRSTSTSYLPIPLCIQHAWNTSLTHHSTDVNFIASQAVARSAANAANGANGAQDSLAHPDDDDASAAGEDAMAALERQARAPAGFVAASTGLKGNIAPAEETAANPDAIDLDDDL